MLDNMGGWAFAALVAMASPFLWKWAAVKLPVLIAESIGRGIKKALAAEGVEDPDLRELIEDLTLALVEYAEKKLPDQGFGPNRTALIVGVLSKLPLIGIVVKANPNRVASIIKSACIKLDAKLKDIQRGGAA